MNDMPQTPMMLRPIVRDWLDRSDALSALPNSPVVPAEDEAPKARSRFARWIFGPGPADAACRTTSTPARAGSR